MKVIPIGNAVPVQDVVDICRRLLEGAESGELRSIVYVCERVSGARDVGWSACSNAFNISADLARLQHRIQQLLDEGTVENENYSNR